MKKTTNYNLPLYEANDLPNLLDGYNGAMELIDKDIKDVSDLEQAQDKQIEVVSNDLAAEVSRAKGAESNISKSLDAEIARATERESTIEADVAVNTKNIARNVAFQSDFSNTYVANFENYANNNLSNISTYPNGLLYLNGYFYVGWDNNGTGTINKYSMNANNEFVFVDSCVIEDSENAHCSSIAVYNDYLYICGNSSKVSVVDVSTFKYVGYVQLPNACETSYCVAYTAAWAQGQPTLVCRTVNGHAFRYFTLKSDGLTLDETQPILHRDVGFTFAYGQTMCYWYGRIFELISYNNTSALISQGVRAGSYIAIWDINADSATPIIMPVNLDSIRTKVELEGITRVNNDLVITDVSRNAYIIKNGALFGQDTDVDFNFNFPMRCIHGGVPSYTLDDNGAYKTVQLSSYAKETRNRNMAIELEFKLQPVGHTATIFKMPLYSNCAYTRTFQISGGLLIIEIIVNYQTGSGLVTLTTTATNAAGTVVDQKYNASEIHLNIPGTRFSTKY